MSKFGRNLNFLKLTKEKIRYYLQMGIINSKDIKKKINEATSNSSLSKIRYVITEKPKWKVFKKKEVKAIPAYHTSLKPMRGCLCGNTSPCKQKVTPRGVTIHYPQKPILRPLHAFNGFYRKKPFKTLSGKAFRSSKVDKGGAITPKLNMNVKKSHLHWPPVPKMPKPHLPKLSIPKITLNFPGVNKGGARSSLSNDMMFMPFAFSGAQHPPR